MSIKEITSVEHFEQIIKDPKAIIKVSTSTCGPCKAVAPLFKAIAEEHPEANFYELFPEKSTELSNHARFTLQITGVPAFFVYEEGALTNRFSAALPKSQLMAKFGL